jgi:hypothetical protein
MLAEFSPSKTSLFAFSSRAGRETKPATANSKAKRDPSAYGSDGIGIKDSRDGSQIYDRTAVKGRSKKSQEISQDEIDRKRTEILAKAKFQKSQEILPPDYKVNSKLESHSDVSGNFSLSNFLKAFARPLSFRPEKSETRRKEVASHKDAASNRASRTSAQSSNRETRSAQNIGGNGPAIIKNYAQIKREAQVKLEDAAEATWTPGAV